MTVRRTTSYAARAALVACVALVAPACAAGGRQQLSTFQPLAHSHSKPASINKHALLYPKKKYYGIFVPGAPASISPVDNIAQETGKQPNLSLYFQAWDSGAASGTPNFSTTVAQNACAAGLLPMLTWESWDTSVSGDNGVAWAQKAFAPHKIAEGDYDAYIKATAQKIAALGCPIALRFDQEVNGYWYPWGVTTTGMPGTPASRAKHYVHMWRHVWKIFQSEGATNVIWVWSPNFSPAKHTGMPDLSTMYPGKKYVDWIGIDGYYYNNPNQTFKGLFGPTIDQLKTFAEDKPWLIAETGVGTGPTKPHQIKNLLHAVAQRKRFNGMVYFDQYKPNDRSDWRFDAPGDTTDLNAFTEGIDNHAYADGKPGSLS